ncbi:glycosyltransferase family 2 protein [Lentisphaera marina]|uniref:glycosyltransferase family 2 protein n=1 Tax=Lentisphaera marina TaxID=1111041 RepID=UPI002365B435|nr:glycosyltransferase family 2 protein [Lentisphaera marina]MDD7987224.1 glycosyltransferase family 2 protein [Lentisphaera marina]
MNIKKVAIIMRSKNEQPYVREALENLLSQTYSAYNLYNVDSGSTDGTLEVVQVFSESVKKISSDSYVPGTVLNDMISNCDEEIVVFLNADAIPQDIDWLRKLLEPILENRADATFSRQLARDDAHFIVKYDYSRTYKQYDHSEDDHKRFSAVACAFKREVWEKVQFYADGYAEDLVWAIQCHREGFRFKYVHDAVVEHSHNYGIKSLFRKKFRHGIVYYRLQMLKPSVFRQLYLCARELARDLIKSFKKLNLKTIPYNILYRVTIHLALYRGVKIAARRKEAKL